MSRASFSWLFSLIYGFALFIHDKNSRFQLWTNSNRSINVAKDMADWQDVELYMFLLPRSVWEEYDTVNGGLRGTKSINAGEGMGCFSLLSCNFVW